MSAETESGPGGTFLNSLPREEREHIEAVRVAIVEKFNVSALDVGVVPVTYDDGRRTVVVMMTAVKGLQKGSWNQVMDRQSTTDFTIEVGGQSLDTREGMSWHAYQAFVRGGPEPSPDSEQSSDEEYRVGLVSQPVVTRTLLTAEELDEVGARCGISNHGIPYLSHLRPDVDRDGIPRFRPAVEVELDT